MALHNFEGDVDNINQHQLEFIREVIIQNGHENSKVTFEPVGLPGDNYVANVKRIIIEGEQECLKLIAKIAPSHPVMRQLMNSHKLFEQEHIMYAEVLPRLVQLQKDANIPEDEQLKYAKCYGSIMDEPNEVILLEDLKVSNYTMLDRFKPLSNDCIKSVLKNFAKLHSLSYALQEKDSATYDEFKGKLIDVMAAQIDTPEMKFFFQSLDDETVTFLEDPHHISLVKNRIVKSMAKSIDLSRSDSNKKSSVILQGDSWTNNIMFRFKDDILTDSIMIDYQLSRHGCPVSDLTYMIFSCTDYESRKQHFYDWIDYYRSELDRSLSNFNLSINNIYPREQLDADFKRYGSLAFSTATMLASLLVRKSDDAAKIKEAMKDENIMDQVQEMAISQTDLETRTLFKNKIVGLLNSFIEFDMFEDSTVTKPIFEGDVDNINEHQLQFIRDIIIQNGHENSKVTFEQVGLPGDNYAANVKRIIIEGEQGCLKLIVKIAPSHPIQRQLMNSHKIFEQEHVMYAEVLPRLVQLQKEANIPEDEQLKYAKCYGTIMEEPNEVILLEDLKVSNYTTLDRFKPLSMDCIKSVLKNLAVLHSLSHVLQQKDSALYDKLKGKLTDVWAAQGHTPEMKAFYQSLDDEAVAFLEDPHHISLVKNRIVKSLAKSIELSRTDSDKKSSAILQGDAWSNNIMFRFKDDILTDSIMIDYQMSKHGCPVIDLTYMLFGCTDYESRKQHFHNWIDYYHSELDKSLSNFNLNVNDIYPREQLSADFKRYGTVSYLTAILLASMLVRKSDDAAKVKELMQGDNVIDQVQEMSITRLDLDTRTHFKNKVLGIVNSFIEFDMFDELVATKPIFEGNVDNINEHQLEFIRDVIIQNGHENSKVTFEEVGLPGDNYVANVKRIIIEGEQGSLKLIAKIAPSHPIQRQLMNSHTLFDQEHIMYAEVLPRLVQLQKDANIPEDEQLKYAKCYGSIMEEPNEVILLEDLKVSNYTMLDRFKPLSNDCIKSVLKNFAKLHSLSYVLQEKDSATYDEFKGKLIDLWASQVDMPEMKVFFQSLDDEVVTFLEDPEHISLIKNRIVTSMLKSADLSRAYSNKKSSVLLQGDSWTNNIMFRFKDGIVTDSIMIDYQLSRHGCPVSDLTYMIFSCTDYESRKFHFYDWIDYYRSELDKSLSNFNLSINNIYPPEQLDADFKQYGSLAFSTATMLASMLVRKTDDAAKIKEVMKEENSMDQVQEMGVSQLDLETRTLFKNKILGLVNSFIEFDLFDDSVGIKHNFEGEIDNISESQLECINNLIKASGHEYNKVIFEDVGLAGDNYVANVKRIILDGEHGYLKLIAKIAPSNPMQRQLMNSHRLFEQEHVMYTEVLPKLVQLQKDANIPEEEQFKYAKCYGTVMEEPNEIILLEDLKMSNFTILDRFKPLSNDCVKSVLNNFAVLHSLSYVFKQKEPVVYDELKKKLIDVWASQAANEQMKIFFQSINDEVVAILDEPRHINLAKNRIVKSMEESIYLSEADFNNKYSVFLQGDSWTNNIMFRFKDEILTDSIMIDYQMSKHGCPVIDLMYMIFSCTDYEMRKQNFYDWMDYYHSELDKSLSNFNLNVKSVYPKEQLFADLKRYGTYSFSLAACLSNILVRKTDDAAKMKEVMKDENIFEQVDEFSVSRLDLETKSLFKKRIVGLVNSFKEFDLI